MTPLLDRINLNAAATKKKLFYLALAVLLGGLFTLVSYPGIFYSDSYGRWFLAENMARGNMAVQDDWLSVPPQLFMALLYKITQNYASFTLLQSVAFFFTAFCAIDFFTAGLPRRFGGPLAGLLFLACPVFYGFSVYIEMGVGCLIALLWLLMLLLGVDHEGIKAWRPLKKVAYGAACFILYFVMLGFRQNAFTVLPVLVVVVVALCRRAKNAWPAILHGAAVALSWLLILALPALLHFGIRNGSGSLSVGFLWETVAMLGELEDKPEYADMLDYLGEEGTTKRAVERNNYQSIYGYHDEIPNTVVGQGDNPKRIRQNYFYLMTHEPGTYFKVKGEFISRALGIREPLALAEYDYDRDGRMEAFGMRDTARRQDFHQSYIGFMETFKVLRRPWAVFLIVLGLLLAALKWLPRAARGRLAVLYGTAVFFYGSFLVNTQSQEFRYFFVPLVLLYLCGAACLCALCGAALSFINKKRVRSPGGAD